MYSIIYLPIQLIHLLHITKKKKFRPLDMNDYVTIALIYNLIALVLFTICETLYNSC